MRRLLPLLLLACSHPAPPAPAPPPWSPPELVEFERTHPLTPMSPTLRRDVATDGKPGDLVPLPGGALGYIERGCEQPSDCGCTLAPIYRYGRQGDRLVIVHAVPDVKSIPGGGCDPGCGMRMAPPRDLLRDLGPINADKVERLEVHYQWTVQTGSCIGPSPRS
jgi:hypothetical protein